MYKLENDVQWTDDLKDAFKHNATRAKILYDNIEINEDNYLVDVTLDEQRYISNYGFVGTATARKIELNLLDVDRELNLENKEIILKIGADYEGETYYINYGNFIVDGYPEHDETNGKTRVVAYDYMIKFNKPYQDRVTYPCKLSELLEDVCQQAGVVLGSNNFLNKDFDVTDNQFEGMTLRQVLQEIGKCAFSWARIGQDNKLYLDFSLTPDYTENITIDEYKLNSFKKAIEYYGPVNQVTYADSNIQGQEEKVPEITPVGDIKELVIYDNLFAYTTEKRRELIQAGTALLGLTYMPISQLELIGFAYLDSRDTISVNTLDEQVFNSRVFGHKIIYNGTLHDEIVNEGTSNNEEVYKNTATSVFQDMQTQININKAMKNILLITQEVDEQNNKIAQIEITTDGIKEEVSNIYNTTKTATGNNQIVLTECIKGYLLKLRIIGNNTVFEHSPYPANDLYPSNDLFPKGDSVIVVTDENENSVEYDLGITEVLRANDEVYDEYILENNFAKVIRRVNSDGTTKEVEEIENIGTYQIDISQGTNTIEIKNYSAKLEIVYVFQNAYTDQFTTQIQMESVVTRTAEEINSEVRKKVGEDEIISKINQSAEAVTILANKLGLTANDVINLIAGTAINLTSKNITINSNNFNVDSNGNLICSNANVSGTITSNNATITGGEIKLKASETTPALVFEKTNGLPVLEVRGTNLTIGPNSAQNDFAINLHGDLAGNLPGGIEINDGGETMGLFVFKDGGTYTSVQSSKVTTPQVIQTSKESKKKNIEKYIDSATEIVKNSEIYSYNFKSEDDSTRKHIGFVIGDEGGNYKTPNEVISGDGEGIDDYTMTSILWKAFQEQQQTIEKLQQEINNFKGGINNG